MACLDLIANHDLSIAIDIGMLGARWRFRNPDETYQDLTGNVFTVRFYRGEHETEELATWSSTGTNPKLALDLLSTPHELVWVATLSDWEQQIGRYYRLSRQDSLGEVTPIARGWVRWV
jgi:hypothetical protein